MNEEDDAVAHGEYRYVEDLCRIISRHCCDVLTIICLPRECSTMRKMIFENMGTCSFVEAKNKWYKFRFTNTSEYDNLLAAMKTYSETPVSDPKYEEAANTLRTQAMKYIEKKGGMLKEAVRSEGETRREIALLALSTVDPAEAHKIVEAANASKKSSNKISLDELAERAGIGKRKESKKEASVKDVEIKGRISERPKANRPKL